MAEFDYDVFIIGGGQAGIPLAWALAGHGMRVALAERKLLGGSCVNFGCTPTKAAIASAKVAHQARRAGEYGINIPTVEPDFTAVLARARRVAAESRDGLDKALEHSDNPKLIRVHARLEGQAGEGFRIRAGEQRFTAKQVVLNTGTRSLLPRIEGIEKAAIIHAGNWLEQEELPRHLAILGGGYIGLEMGQFYQRMGSTVTIIESGPCIVAREDEDVADALQGYLTDEGIEFQLSTRLNCIDTRPDITLQISKDGDRAELRVSHLFVATGRVPNSDDLGLETVALKPDEHGFIRVNERLSTAVDGLWAAGDIHGAPFFTHTAWDDYRILMSQMTGDKSRTMDRVVPYAVFTDPELGRVGMSEAEARKAGRQIKVSRFDMTHSGKASEMGEERGFIKVVADAATNEILGAATLCADGAELIHLYSDALRARQPYTFIRDGIYLHPSLGEAVQSAVSALD